MLRLTPRQRLATLLALATSLVSTGCIVPESEYGPARQSPVFIVESSVTPSTLSPLVVNAPTATVHLAITAFAEDAGEELMSALYVDYKHTHGYFLISHRHGTKSLETPRLVEYNVNSERLPSGCHALTIMLFHESAWDDANSELIGIPPDLVSVTWFASIEADGTPVPLASCPDVSTESPITGG